MKNKKETKKTKKTKDDLNSTLWLDKEQKKGLSSVFAGFTIAGGLTTFSYLGGKSDINGEDAMTIVLGTILSAVMIIWFRKEQK